MKNHFVFYTALVLVLIGGALQKSYLIAPLGITPNYVVVALVISTFFVDDFFWYALLIAMATLSVRFGPWPGKEGLAVAIVGVGLFYFRRRLVAAEFFASALLVAVSTAALYLIVSPQFIIESPGVLLAEMGYNVFTGMVFFEVFRYVQKTRSFN